METFSNQVDALTGFSTTDNDALSDWLTSGAREIINMMPRDLKKKCTTETTLNNSATTMDMDGVGEILYVNRLSADTGGSRIPCREVSSMYGELSNDDNSIYKASETDPVYWILSSGDAAILNVIPTPTANQTAIVHHLSYPSVSVADVDTIPNFPDEAEPLVVLYVASKMALQFATTEADNEDSELYAMYSDMYAKLKAEYMQGLQALKGGEEPRR